MDPKFFRKYIDILSERGVENPETGEIEFSPGQAPYPVHLPDYGPGSEAWEIQQELNVRGLDDVGGNPADKATDSWYKSQNFTKGSGPYAHYEYSRPKQPQTVDKFGPKGAGYNIGDVKYDYIAGQRLNTPPEVAPAPETKSIAPQMKKSGPASVVPSSQLPKKK